MKLESSIWLDPNRPQPLAAVVSEQEIAPFFGNDLRSGFVFSYLLLNMTDSPVPLKDFILGLERDIIEHALRVSQGNQKRAASLLRLKETTLSEKMSRLGLRQR